MKRANFVFRNRKWKNLDNCCELYGLEKDNVRHYQYDYGDTIQEALEKSNQACPKDKIQV